ncbi:peptidylprolyl isomerase [Paracoccaceae bacterium]|nr:peptidylprolyl isomerase [Paracoccaceae bacterium]
MARLKGNISKFFAWIMVSIVIISLAGFGIQDVILGSMGQNIATIGKEKITVDEFLKSVENEILNFSQKNNVTLSIEEAKKYGLINKALNDLLAKKIFDNLIKNEGISRGDKSVADYIKTVESFKNINGGFDVEKYKRYVAATGVNIKEFESALKDDLVRELILNVFEAPTKIETTMLEKSIEHYFQSRNISFIELNLNTFRDFSKKPSVSDISIYFEKRKDQFKSPNRKTLKLAAINFVDLVNQQTIGNKLIKKYYDENVASFKNEEKRLIDILSFSDEGDDNKKRIQAIKENSELFDEEISSRGLKTEDVTLGFVNKSMSKENENLKKLFDKENIGVYGPFETDLGLAIYRIREISAETQIHFFDAKSDIRNLLASEIAKNETFKLLEDLNNEVAAGQTLEDLSPKFSLSIETLEIENNELPDRFKKDPNAKTLFDNVSDQITEFVLLGDNSLLAMKVDNELKSRALTLDEASKDIKEILLKENLLIGTKSYFDKKLKPGNENFLNQLFELNSDEEIFVEIKKRKLFRFNPDGQVAKGDLERIFSLKEKEFIVFYDNSKLFLALVENITNNDIDKELKRTLLTQRKKFFKQSLRQNFINNYLNFIKQDTDINVNEGLIERTLLNLRRTG